jgi:hypothetical protein
MHILVLKGAVFHFKTQGCFALLNKTKALAFVASETHQSQTITFTLSQINFER